MMKSKKLISAILAAASIAGGVVGSQAADASTLEAKVDSYTSRVQQAEKDIKGLQTKVDALDTTGIADNKAGIEANKNAIATQGAQISQIQQDMAQDAMDHAAEMDKLTTKVNQKADKADVEANKNDIASNAAAIKTETQKREDAVKGLQDKLTVANGQIENEKTTRENAVSDLQNQVTANKNAIATQGSQISQIQQDMAQDAMDHAAEMDKLTTKVNQKADKADVEANKNDIASNAAAIKTETQKRENAVNKLQNQVTVASGRIDNLKNQVTENKGAIEKLQTQWNDSNRAFNAEQVNKIDTNKNDIGTIFGQLDQGAYNQKDGYVVKKDDTIGGALKNLDKNADKQHWQIEALEKKTGINTPLTNGAGNLSAGVNENTRKIDAETDARIDADNKLSDRIYANKTAIENEATARKDADQKLQKQIDKNGIKADTALKVAGNGVLYNHATNLTDGVNENTKKIDANVKDIAANKTAIENEATARKDADTKLQNNIKAEATTRENAVNALNSRIDQLGSDANKGIAKASALAALHPLDYDPDNKFDIAAAGGFYKGENAFALGAFYRPNRNVMLSMGTTLTDGDNAYNVGLTFKIGKSGKHTEAGLTTADLYAMIGAMQDKMDQQQKKIEELEAKQAK